MSNRFALALILSLATSVASAKVFRNAYISFEAPDSWKCELEHTEWVCRSLADKESKEAIIILTAKEVGPTDSFDAYTQHLGKPTQVQSRGGVNMTSEIKAVPKQSQINNQVWIDGLHLHGEVPNYFTRYLATIKDQIAILVTFSAHKDYYSKYATDFFRAVQSLQVIATKNILNDPSQGPLHRAEENIFGGVGGSGPMGDMPGQELPPPPKAGGGKNTKNLLFGIAILLAAAAAYVFLKMKKK